VHTLGVDDAKPQAIAALMQSSEPNSEGPTRQNIKSHLQKYRLLLAKRREQNGTGSDSPVHTYGRRAQREAAQAERGRQEVPRGRGLVRGREQKPRQHHGDRGDGAGAVTRSPSDDAGLSANSGTAEFSAAVNVLGDDIDFDLGMLHDQLAHDQTLEGGLQGVFGMNGTFDLAEMTDSSG